MKAAKGVAWTTAANWGCQFLSFCFYLGLARLLNPQEFGQIALAGVYLAFIQVFVTQGFGVAIVQRRDLDEEHLDSAFWIAVTTAAAFCVCSIAFAGWIAHLFKDPQIAPVIRWLCLSMLFNALGAVPTAILTRDMEFRPLAIRLLAATGASGVVGITLAFLGCGVWSLVAQQLISSAVGCACLWFAVPWRPRLTISRRHLRDLYGFSLKVTGTDVLWFFSKRSDQTVVGYTFGTVGLGPYSLASRIVNMVLDGIVGPLQSVALPALSKIQSDHEAFEKATRRFIELSTFLMFPIFAGVAAIAPIVVPVLFGAKWNSAIPFLEILAFYGATVASQAFAYPVMLAKGRPGFHLVASIILSAMTVTSCLLAAFWSPRAVAIALGASSALFAAGFFFALQHFVKLRAAPLIKAMLFPALSSFFMLAAVVWIRMAITAFLKPIIMLPVCILAGAAIYAGTAIVFRPDLVKMIRETLEAMAHRKVAGAEVVIPAGADTLESVAAGSINP